MKTEAINVPGGHEATLAYITKPPEARGSSLWWLQLKKMGFPPGIFGPAYEKDAPKLAAKFAAELLAEAGLAPGLVIVPASASKQFQPYLNALIAAKADLPVLDGAFTKPDNFRAGDKGRTYQQVLDNTTLDHTKLPAGAAAVTRLWIIDDIYNTGNTVGAMATRLKGHLVGPSKKREPVLSVWREPRICP